MLRIEDFSRVLRTACTNEMYEMYPEEENHIIAICVDNAISDYLCKLGRKIANDYVNRMGE